MDPRTTTQPTRPAAPVATTGKAPAQPPAAPAAAQPAAKSERSAGRTFTEAPFSANTRVRSPRGFIWQKTIRGEDFADYLDKIEKFEELLLAHNWQPVDDTRRSAPVAQDPPAASAPVQGQPDEGDDWCSVHQVPMIWHDSNGRGPGWYSHRAERRDGSEYWCKGKPPKSNR